MALVGSISGSTGVVGLTGSLTPGSDNIYTLGTSSSKWLNVVATSFTGSITRLANGSEYLKPGSNVTLTTGSDGSITIASTAGGGGGGTNFFYDTAGAGKIYTTASSVAFTANEAGVDEAGDKGSDVVFYVSGTIGVSPKVALFGGAIVSSGSLSVKDNVSGVEVASISNAGQVSGSGNFIAGGTLTVNGSTITATAPTTINFGNTAATVNIGQSGTGNTLNVRGALDVDSTANIAGNITLSGDSQTVTHSGTGNLTISSTGGSVVVEGTTFAGNDVTVAGNVAVNGGSITTTQTTFNLVNATATTVNIAGAALTTNIGSPSGRVVIPGDFEVQGTTMTVSASNLVIEDPLVGFGFLSGSTPASSTGDRGFVGGYTGGGNSNVAFGYSLSNSAFVATKTNSDATATTFAVNELQPIRASSLQVNGVNAKVTSSDGSELTVEGLSTLTLKSTGGPVAVDAATTQAVDVKFGASTFLQITGSNNAPSLVAFGGKSLTLSGSALNVEGNLGVGIGFRVGGSGYATLVNSGSNALFGASGTRNLILSGSTVALTAGSSGVVFQQAGTTFAALSSTGTTVNFQPGLGYGTVNLATVDALTVNLGSAASTLLNMGNSSGATWISGSVSVPGTFSALGNINLGDASSDRLNIVAAVTSSIIPSDDSAFTLGTADKRWQHIYTGDLHLRNERGDYTLIEETDFLSIRFNKNGKRYKFLLERVPELDEPAR